MNDLKDWFDDHFEIIGLDEEETDKMKSAIKDKLEEELQKESEVES